MLPRPSSLVLSILLLVFTNLTAATLSPLPPRTSAPSPPPKPTSPPSSSLLSTLLALANTTSQESDISPDPLARRCAKPCGYYGQVCCGAGQKCYTNALTQAACTYAVGATANPASGYWSYYTMTNTYLQTQTLSTWIPVAEVTSTTPYVPLPAAPLPATATETQTTTVCNTGAGYSQCGTACCSSSEYCYQAGVCMSSSSGLSAPLRVTSSTLLTLTTYISPTTTEAFQSAIATSNVTLTESDSNNAHLSSGAIAGIVIGVIFLLIFLFLLLLYFCARTLWEACFGRRRGNDRTRVTTEEYRRQNNDSQGYNSRQWYGRNGGGGYGPARPQRREKESNGLGWAGVAAGLGGLAAALGWRRRQEEKRRQQQQGRRGRYQKSEQSESYDDSTEGGTSYTSVERDERVYRNGRRE